MKRTAGGKQWSDAQMAAFERMRANEETEVRPETRRSMLRAGVVEEVEGGVRLTSRGRIVAQTLANLKEEAGQ
jgi:hypothetical protein